jgi:hypothetical protein
MHPNLNLGLFVLGFEKYLLAKEYSKSMDFENLFNFNGVLAVHYTCINMT